MTSRPAADPLFSAEAVREDGFLDGRVRCLQPRRGYRSGLDAVFLAAAVAPRTGDRVLELGCGAGVALCCLGRRVAGLTLAGLELQAGYADLARRNLQANALTGDVFEGDVARPPQALRARSFDHVFFNPPYFDAASASPSRDPGRDIAHRAGPATLAAFVDQAIRRLAPGGTMTAILPIAALQTTLQLLDARTGAVTILPIAARVGRDADRAILSARKGARTPLRLRAPLVVHAGASHAGDGDDYTPAARAVLRDGAPLDAG